MIVLVQNRRHRFVKKLVEHAVPQQSVAVSLFGERFMPRLDQELSKGIGIKEDVLAHLRLVNECFGIR